MATVTALLESTLAPGGIALTVLAFALVLLWIRQRRDTRRLRSALGERDAALARLSDELCALLDCSRGMAQRVQQLEQRTLELARQVDLLETPHSADGHAARALQLLRQGYSVADIAAIRELTPSETELLSSLAAFKEVA